MNGLGPIPVLPTNAPDRRAFTIPTTTAQFQHIVGIFEKLQILIYCLVRFS